MFAARRATRVHVDAECNVERDEETDHDKPLIRKSQKGDKDRSHNQDTLCGLPELQTFPYR
jgi:hypothetical protein